MKVELDNEVIHVLAILFSALFDLPAKCLVQEMIQFNGEFGCSVCEIQGQSLETDIGGTVRVFPKHEPEPDEFLRNERRTIARALIALEERTTVKGIRGMSVLGGIPYFDSIENIPFDFTHGAYLGVAKLLLCKWFESNGNRR